MNNSHRENIFLVFEGIDFAGKTTIAKTLSNAVGGRYIKSPPELLAPIKKEILENSAPLARFCYFLSSNIQIATMAKNLLNKTHVMCDRYIWSTIAYHAALENLNTKFVISLAQPFLSSLVMPDFVIFLTIDRETQLLRSKNRVGENRLQHRLLISERFQRKLKKAYNSIENFFDIQWIELDTSNMSVEKTIQEIIQNVGIARSHLKFMETRHKSST